MKRRFIRTLAAGFAVAAEAYKAWRQDIDAWRHHGNDFAYHYLGSPKIIYEIGEAFGKRMLQMLGKSAN